MARLVIFDGTNRREVEITDAVTIAGRSSDNKIHLDDKQASRRHFQIEKTEFGYKLVDLESRNGTKVNDRVVNQALLKPGDRIQVGKHTVTFEDAQHRDSHGDAAARPVPPPPAPEGGPARPVPPASSPSPAVAAPGEADARPRRRTSSGNTTAMVVNRTARLEQAREQQMIRWVGVGAGLFIAILVILIVVSGSGTSATPGDQDYDKAFLAFKRKQYDVAREILARIPAEPKAVREKANGLLRQIDGEQKMAGLPSEAETRDFDALSDFCDKNKGNPAMFDRMLALCAEFRKKYPSSMSLPKVEQYVKTVGGARQGARGKELEAGIAAVQEHVQRKEFAPAVKGVNELIAKHNDDVDARATLVKLHDEIVDQAEEHFKAGQAAAKNAQAGGQKDEAARIYEALGKSLGDGSVEELSVWAQIVKTALKGLQ